jgi:CHRD domain
MGVAGNVVVPPNGMVTIPATTAAALQKDFTKHLLYVKVHTVKNPNGEIRGQLGG